VPQIKGTGTGVRGLHVDADLSRILFEKPVREETKQFGSDTRAPIFGQNVDPPQFALTIVPAGQMAGGECHDRAFFDGNEANSRSECLLRIEKAAEISRDAALPIFASAPFQRPDVREGLKIR